MDANGPWVAPTTVDADGVDSLHLTADRYQLRMETDMDAHSYAERVAEHDTGSPVYALQRGRDWAEAGEREERVTTGTPLEEGEDAVYIQQEGTDARYTRAFYAADDRDPPEITVTVPQQHGMYTVAPLHDALKPFLDDGPLLAAVKAVERELDRYENGAMDRVSF